MADLNRNGLVHQDEGVEEIMSHPVSLSMVSWDDSIVLFGNVDDLASDWVFSDVSELDPQVSE